MQQDIARLSQRDELTFLRGKKMIDLLSKR